jgi:hypothetical protein
VSDPEEETYHSDQNDDAQDDDDNDFTDEELQEIVDVPPLYTPRHRMENFDQMLSQASADNLFSSSHSARNRAESFRTEFR